MRHYTTRKTCQVCGFQFTHPGKGATDESTRARSLVGFQFTHPGKGATSAARLLHRLTHVSIHAPWEGCDSLKGASSPRMSSFNSRTLGRVRRQGEAKCRLRLGFQFTHPGKGATAMTIPTIWHKPCFNSRTLGRVRPLGGCKSCVTMKFQFTHPGKGATSTLKKGIRLPLMFQFTHPGKGATAGQGRISLRPCRFNSRTLGRVRLYPSQLSTPMEAFQFTHPGKGATSPCRTLFQD